MDTPPSTEKHAARPVRAESDHDSSQASSASTQESQGLSDLAMKALSHPLRRRILGLLDALPKARVTSLAERLDSSPNSVSFHLRSLEKAGLVERAEGNAGDRRESYWRRLSLDPAVTSHTPETGLYLNSQHNEQLARLSEVFRQAQLYLASTSDERELRAELVTRTLLLDEARFVEMFQEVTQVLTNYATPESEVDPDRKDLLRWDITTFAVRGWDGAKSN